MSTTIDDVQQRINAMPAAMSAKGLRNPVARFSIVANEELQAYLSWDDKKTSYGSKYEWVKSKTPAGVLNKMDAFIAKLPSPEETRMKEFMGALSDVIELGRQNGIEVDHVNPLVETMRRLSENIITDQRVAA
ncbi:hypothetical protein [Rhizobium rhizogenes]|uniref:hypothetical protein n=1 Tax=Rhizobium rhizogenes TaxID=359 RepID=UPI0004D8EEBB|nr:hypothetical protein [Rhizobium rhizogenes]KEA07516.1 hypothetical protein CN09_11500 [Rhizobium rhizogenes]NTJ22204.1 hypothetical protein [Rhizobium rhizogenes]QUE80923.1 hypothetical protein EML492_03690 [Rhizobium rhizogenes]TQO80970.1 hypothetical protein FFE80_07710 [Rhizobium rhizogenes]TRB51564.1 hypothetical protein EXN69_26595 [Rhizobium rhizogenes]